MVKPGRTPETSFHPSQKYGTDKLSSNDTNSLKLIVINLCESYHFPPNQKSDIYKIKPSLAPHFIADEYGSDKRY